MKKTFWGWQLSNEKIRVAMRDDTSCVKVTVSANIVSRIYDPLECKDASFQNMIQLHSLARSHLAKKCANWVRVWLPISTSPSWSLTVSFRLPAGFEDAHKHREHVHRGKVKPTTIYWLICTFLHWFNRHYSRPWNDLRKLHIHFLFTVHFILLLGHHFDVLTFF